MIVRLWAIAKHHEALFDGWAASRGVDPMDLPPARFFNLLYFWIIKDAAEGEQEKFDRKLWRPPVGEAPAPGSPWSPEAETASFKAFAGEFKAM